MQHNGEMGAAMMFGADGILMGTSFYASRKAEAPEAKRRIVAAGSGQTVRSIIFDLSRGNHTPGAFCATVTASVG